MAFNFSPQDLPPDAPQRRHSDILYETDCDSINIGTFDARRHSDKSLLKNLTPTTPVKQMDPLIKAQILQDRHATFSSAFSISDPVKMLEMFDSDVELLDGEGRTYESADAVLSYLVGAQMTTLSTHVRKRSPVEYVAPDTTIMTYVFGVVACSCPMQEEITWKETPGNQFVISKIRRTMLEEKCIEKLQKPVMCTLLSPLLLTQKLISPESPSVPQGTSKQNKKRIAIVRIAVGDLSSLKKHRVVNPYVEISTPANQVIWKSPVLKKTLVPSWEINEEVVVNDSIESLIFTVRDRRLFTKAELGAFSVQASDLPQKFGERIEYIHNIATPEHPVDMSVVIEEKLQGSFLGRFSGDTTPAVVDVNSPLLKDISTPKQSPESYKVSLPSPHSFVQRLSKVMMVEDMASNFHLLLALVVIFGLVYWTTHANTSVPLTM